MKSPFLGLRAVAYFVSDIHKAKAWYADVFKTQPYSDEPFYVGFGIAGYELGLHPQGDISAEKPQNVSGEIVVASVRDPWGNIIGIIYNSGFKAKN
ncbi:MAG TPA: VOC family protein [Patescibacteria group bacterium]|nr:VOC family protein [Patescibacteria group bacterium]